MLRPIAPAGAGSVVEVIAMEYEYDVVVIGGGAAGLTAAMVLVRARRRVAVIDAGEPRNAAAAHVHGFLSRDGVSPAQLLAAGRGQVLGYGGEVIKGRVRDLEPGFVVRLAGGRELTTRSVLVATGLRDELPEIPGLRERWGNDVLHCPYCHAYEVRDAPIGVLGGDNRRSPCTRRRWSGNGLPMWCSFRTGSLCPRRSVNG